MALSDQMTQLAAETKKLEDSAQALAAKNHAALKTRHDELTAQMDDAAQKATAAIQGGQEKLGADWAGFKQSTSDGLDGLKAKHADRKAAHDAKRAEKDAEKAEDFAAECIAWAIYAVAAAEYALVDAALARADADAAAEAITTT